MTSLVVLRQMQAEYAERLDAISAAIAALESQVEKKSGPPKRKRGTAFTSDPAAGDPDWKSNRGGGTRLD